MGEYSGEENTSFPNSAAPIWKRFILLICGLGLIFAYIFYARPPEEPTKSTQKYQSIPLPFEVHQDPVEPSVEP